MGGGGESASCLNKWIMLIHKGKWAFLESGHVQVRAGRGRQRRSQLRMAFVVIWISAALSCLLVRPVTLRDISL